LHCDNRTPPGIQSRPERPGIESHYELLYDKNNIQDIIPYEMFDYAIIKLSTNPIADSLVNEIWPLLRVLWLAVGEFKLDVRFDPTIDLPEFGPGSCLNDGLRPNDYFKAHYKFEIGRHGAWHADFATELQAGGPNGNPTQDGKTYAFTHAWQGTGTWDRPE
jgi:hypothetical protein